uniref:Ig-like domain-containing protein n=2 Tax=Anabas testudineus TaxID=64144 RepID=A0A3Q1H6U9_ANATE
MYHCAVLDSWTQNHWSGTYLSVKGNSERTSTVVQTVSDPVLPGDSVTLQCSVLSDSDNKTCPGDHSVYWFRAGSDQSHPEIIYTGGNNECEKRSHSVKSCVYRFSKNVSSSDAGTYYCAVATCGQILFGDGTKLRIEQKKSEFIALVTLIVSLAISVIGNIVFICYRSPACEQFKGRESDSSQSRHDNQDNMSRPVHDLTIDGHDLNYAALQFSRGKGTRGKKKKELRTEEIVYSQVKY